MIFFTLFFKYINLVNKIVIPQKSVIAKPRDFWSTSSGNALVRSFPKKQAQKFNSTPVPMVLSY